jgi:CHAT domain-containing protein
MRAGLCRLAPVLLLAGCSSRSTPPSPAKQFQEIRSTFLRGDLVKAHQEASHASSDLAKRDPVWSWKFRLLDADVLVCQGQSPSLLKLLDADLPQSLGQSDLNVRRHMFRAIAYSRLGRPEQADAEMRAAKALCDSLRCQVRGELARDAGAIALDRNDLDSAQSLFRQSLGIARQDNDRFLEATDLLNLGWVTLRTEHYDESIDWTNLAYAAAQSLDARQIMEKASGNRAWAFYKMGDFERALTLVSEAETSAHQLGFVIDEVEWLNNHGLIYFQMDQLPLAESYFRRSLKLVQESQNRAQIVDALNSLSYVLVEEGQFGEAQRYNDQALALTKDLNDRMSELPTQLVRGKIAARTGNSEEAQKLLTGLAVDPQSDASVKWEARNELAKLAEREHRFTGANREYLAAIKVIEDARGKLQHEDFRLPFMANAAHLYDDYIRFLVHHETPLEALRAADNSHAQTLREGLRIGRGVTLSRAAFDPPLMARRQKATVLFYWLSPQESYLWAITPLEARLFRLPPAAEIDALVAKFQKQLAGPRDPLDEGDTGSKLYETLVAPAATLIAPDREVIVIPDGSLAALNFETLIVPGPTPHYWIQDATILNATSLELLATREAASQAKRLLLIGDALVPSGEYAPLPNAQAEMNKIAGHFLPTLETVFQQKRATPAAYLDSHPDQFSYIHFVAHGTASRLSPLDSAVILAKSSTADDSFKLYAREIVTHPLHADLVTISACYGAGSRAYAGEGLVGLSWAFLRAGAHNVIGALWEVSDASTPQLMNQLYEGLSHGQRPAEALRAAKLSLLHSDGVFRKPFYWAPFQLYTGS